MTKIMLVEDDNNLREIYEARLAAEGYEIVAAQNGEAALAIAAKERPDMIISDVMMPKISGFEMLDILRNTEALRNVKIIMLTALGQAEDSQRANSLGADRYLVKSQVTLEDIVKATHELLDGPQPADSDPPAVITPDAAPEPLPDLPAAAAETAAPAAANPEPDSAQLDTVPVASESVSPMPGSETTASDSATSAAEATGPAATPPVGAPVSKSGPAQSVITIPVSDGPVDTPAPVDDTSIPVAAAGTPLAPISGDVVTPEPVDTPVINPVASTSETTEDTSGTTPAPITIQMPDDPDDSSRQTVTSESGESDATDYSSPSTFNTFQIPPSAPAIKEEVDNLAPQSTAAEEAAMKAQIDTFISQADTSPAEDVSTDTTDNSDIYQAVSSAPSAGDVPPESAEAETAAADGKADTPPRQPEVDPNFDVAPEVLDTFHAPVVSAPDGSTVEPVDADVPTPESRGEETGASENVAAEPPGENTMSASDAQAYTDQIVAEAAQDLADNASGLPAPAPSTGSTNSIVSPINDGAKPSLNQLLAVEEAKASAQQAATSTQTAKPNVNAYNSTNLTPAPSTPGDSIDPNSISL